MSVSNRALSTPAASVIQVGFRDERGVMTNLPKGVVSKRREALHNAVPRPSCA